MAGTTREYLSAVQQGEHTLPAGPCFLSPSRLIECFTREVIRRKPEEFKIACLLDLRSLWPAVSPDPNPSPSPNPNPNPNPKPNPNPDPNPNPNPNPNQAA